MDAFGTHVICELSRCAEIAHYDDVERLETLMVEIVEKVGLNQVGVNTHKFEPHGISCTVILQESHMATHIFPELGYAALDVYTCAKQNEPKTHEAARLFVKALGAEVVNSVTLSRGVQTTHGEYALVIEG